MDNFLIHTKKMRPRDWLLDAVLALAAFAFGCLQLVLSSSPIIVADDMFRQMIGIINTTPSPSAYLAMAITTLPLAVRRRFPWPVFIFVLVTFLGMQDVFRGFSLTIVGPAVALYTIAYERSRAEAFIAAALGVVALLAVVLPTKSADMALFVRIQNISYLAVALLAGLAVRNHKDYVAEAEQRSLAAQRSLAEQSARRMEEERVRIAREVHDITAHSLSAISIQAAAADRLLERDQPAAREAVRAIRATARAALDEIRDMVGVLRNGEEQAPIAPTGGTERMGDLLAFLRDAGIQASFSCDAYDRSRVASYIDIALYGIAREAVTNIVRHAYAKNTGIRLSTEDESACLVVQDDGVGVVDQEMGKTGIKGHGIQGMHERVQVLGGHLEVGSRAAGGFLVEARIPLVAREASEERPLAEPLPDPLADPLPDPLLSCRTNAEPVCPQGVSEASHGI
ncbi:MAG: histidine kinase [Coriobacteriaceae bacterium]|nr:histidine kinase [Coriobacteriaceae bacterium]